MKIEDFLRGIGILVFLRREFLAATNHFLPTKTSYSQHGEDREIRSLLGEHDLSGGIYVDVGANHPSVISNTYLFYREGFHGVLVEPNAELCRVLQRYRPRDVVLNIGCGRVTEMRAYSCDGPSVLRRFLPPDDYDSRRKRYEFIPVLPVDIALAAIDYEWVFLLSIDVEGMDVEVLQGAEITLTKTLVVCVEIASNDAAKQVRDFLGERSFRFVAHHGCNDIYISTATPLGKVRPPQVPEAN